MKKDPLSMTISLIQNLNLIQDGEYNINELKNMRGIENHWITIKKYLKMFILIQKYSPEIKFDGSILHISNKNYFNQLGDLEKFVVILFQKNAINEENVIPMDRKYLSEDILESEGFLFKFLDGNCYLTKSGLNVYRSIEKGLTKIIFNDEPLLSIQKIETAETEYNISLETIVEKDTSSKSVAYNYPLSTT